MSGSKTAIVIPARFLSTRLPKKALIEVNGKPIIQYVFEKCKQSELADKVVIATDNEEIFDKAKSFGAEVMMTDDSHQSGSDRIAEVARSLSDYGYIVNVQGDEPMIDPKCIDTAILALKDDDNVDIATLVREITNENELQDPNTVKSVFDDNGFAMYFSRSKIPYERNIGKSKFYAHIGLYAYKKEVLFKMTGLPQSNLEKAESLEQLRALQSGMKIKCSIVDYKPIGIDTTEDLEAFKASFSG